MSTRAGCWRWIVAVAMVVFSGGCVRLLAHRIAHPGTSSALDSSRFGPIERQIGVRSQSFANATGPRLHYLSVPAADYGLDYRYWHSKHKVGFEYRSVAEPQSRSARGTVVLLHGWALDGGSMLPWALALAQQGWQGVIVDLRNHGRSARAPAGFGVREGEDIAALLQSLDRQQRLPRPLYLFGVSYGAVTAAFAAARLRPEVRAVVAMEPFDTAAAGIAGVVSESLSKSSGGGLARRAYLALARRRYDHVTIERAIDRAGRTLALDLRTIDTAVALRAADVCTLVLHGAKDRHIPIARIEAMAATLPRAHFVAVPAENHLTLPLRVDWLAAPLAAWLDAVAGTSPAQCPGLPPLPPAPTRVDAAQVR